MRRAPLRAVIGGALAVSLVTVGVVAIRSASADTAPRRIVNGWLPYWSMSDSMSSVTQNADLWAEASPFWYHATGATTINKKSSGAGDPTVINDLRSHGIKVVPTVTESLDGAAMAALLANATQRAAHVSTLVNLVTTGGYDGVDLDYESMNFGGTATDKASVRTGFVTLVRELGTALDAKGKLLSVTVGSRTSAGDPNWSVFDYAGIAPSADRFRIMTYDYHWSGGSPGAVAPVAWVDRVLAYAVTAVPAGKIEVGVPLYGYDWPADPAQPDGYGTATSKSYQQAEALRAQYGAVRQWSSADGAPYFSYTANGVNHVVWYNDADATKAKMTLIEKYGVRGLVFWAVGAEDARQWSVLRSYAIQKSTQLTVSAPAAIGPGRTATVSGKLSTTSGAAVPGQKVTLQWRSAGSTSWGDVATGTTSSTGAVSFGYAPSTNGYFRLYAPSSWSYLSSTSPAVQTLVQWRGSVPSNAPTIGRVPPVRPTAVPDATVPAPRTSGSGT
jgi:spore germination protein